MAPEALERILGGLADQQGESEDLLVGFGSKDDGAVFRLNEYQGLVATTDFFMPIVDDPYDFGRVAAVNALSDVYAMGGKPIMALGILGWPLEVLGEEVAAAVLKGAQAVCSDAGIPLAGGHSIDNPEPVFGLSVNGLVDLDCLKKNDGARAGDRLVLTKPIGTGLYSTARKKGLSTVKEDEEALKWMCQLNTFGYDAARIGGVHAQTDVTGFGLLGHLYELCAASNVQAAIEFGRVPLLPSAIRFLEEGCSPGGTGRNLAYLADKVTGDAKTLRLLADPQTSGGLLMCVKPDAREELRSLARGSGQEVYDIGVLEAGEPRVSVHGGIVAG